MVMRPPQAFRPQPALRPDRRPPIRGAAGEGRDAFPDGAEFRGGAFRVQGLLRADEARREELLEAAGEALWFLVVQREACGLSNTEAMLRTYDVPLAVRLRMGPARRLGPVGRVCASEFISQKTRCLRTSWLADLLRTLRARPSRRHLRKGTDERNGFQGHKAGSIQKGKELTQLCVRAMVSLWLRRSGDPAISTCSECEPNVDRLWSHIRRRDEDGTPTGVMAVRPTSLGGLVLRTGCC